VLYVTSIGRVPDLLRDAPHLKVQADRKPNAPDGALFAIRGLDVEGLPEPRFAG